MSDEQQHWTPERLERTMEEDRRQDRKTHFTGAANLLYQEVEPFFRMLYEARLRRDTKQAEGAEKTIRQIFASRDYDLVEHALHTCSLEAFEITGDWSSDVPDLTAWPKSKG